MSAQEREPTGTDDDEDGLYIDPQQNRTDSSPTGLSSALGGGGYSNLATIARDSTNWLPAMRSLQEKDVIVLLTPVVTPITQDPTDTRDPFETFGRALASRHPRVRHIPYTQRNGITSTHLGFIKRGMVIILCLALHPGQPIQLDFADVAFAVSDNKPVVIVVCCTPQSTLLDIPFPTVIQTSGYTPQALEATAALIFGDGLASDLPGPEPSNPNIPRPRLWPVHEWNEARDISGVWDLWNQNISRHFSIDLQTLTSLLRRPGYAKHYVVRDSRSEEILGFCATYLSYVDQEGEKLIASLAFLLVRSTYQHQGVGLSLHSHAIGQLKKTRGVVRLQLGSTFPRILYGPPIDMQINEEWFRRRGWVMNRDRPGQGQAIYDLVLNIPDWRNSRNATEQPMLRFRPCTQQDMGKVLAMVEEASVREARMGWFDQYSSLMNDPNVKDIVLGVDNDIIVAAALTYTPSCGSPIASNLPWAGRIGNDVGGVTCICTPLSRRDAVLVGLLNACVKKLQNEGMSKIFLDGVSGGVDGFKLLGFQEWAQYKDVWKDT